MGGELKALIETIDFSSKNELLENLRKLRKSTVKLAPQERSAVKEIIGVGIQQAYYTTEKELLRYKRYVSKRNNDTEAENEKNSRGSKRAV